MGAVERGPSIIAEIFDKTIRTLSQIFINLQNFTDFEDLRCRNSKNSRDLLKNDTRIMKIGVKIRIL